MRRFPKLAYTNKFHILPLPPPKTFTDTTILITGGTSGLGLATAVHFLNLGASTVIITARTIGKGDAAKSLIESQVKDGNTGKVQVRLLDMDTFAGIKKFADALKREVESVDYVLLNAGMLNARFKMGKEGWEESLMINTLGTALLAILLLPWLKVAGKGNAHLGFVGSGKHRAVDISPSNWPQNNIFKYYSEEEHWPTQEPDMYAISKLLVLYCANEIAKLAVGANGRAQVIVNTTCPGLVKSDLGRDHRTSVFMGILIDSFVWFVAKTTEVGARRLVLGATSTKQDNGKFFSDQPGEEYIAAVEHNVWGPEGKKMQSQVWKEVLAILEEKIPEVRQIVEAA